jgi:hypothetical protein
MPTSPHPLAVSLQRRNKKRKNITLFIVVVAGSATLPLAAKHRETVVGLGLPQPLTRRRVYPPPPRFWGEGAEGHTRWRERGWESHNSDEGTYAVHVVLFTDVLCEIMSTCHFQKADTHIRPHTAYYKLRPIASM